MQNDIEVNKVQGVMDYFHLPAVVSRDGEKITIDWSEDGDKITYDSYDDAIASIRKLGW